MNGEETFIEEIKIKAAVRVPPGDRWKCTLPNANETIIFDSLTDVLEYIFQLNGNTRFYMDAREGYVHVIKTEERIVEKEPEKRYSLYGEA